MTETSYMRRKSMTMEEQLGAAEAERDALRIQVQDLLGNEVQNVALQAQNRELRQALEEIRDRSDNRDYDIWTIANEAIAKVTSPPVTK